MSAVAKEATSEGLQPLPLAVRTAVVVRSLLVQAAWNYRTMLGTGMAFALTPALRHVHGSAEAVDRALERHASLFNAHPYLTPLALGALARLEAEGASEEMIERFRAAVRGPLGALGDRLVWAGWLPLCSLMGIAVSAAVGPGAGVAAFLIVYNAGHLALRAWGFQVGWASGASLGSRLRELRLTREARRIETGVCLLAGVVAGFLLPSLAGADPAWLPGLIGVLALLVGYGAGVRAWRPAAWIVTLGVGALSLAGYFLQL